jgi:hypothetical protein
MSNVRGSFYGSILIVVSPYAKNATKPVAVSLFCWYNALLELGLFVLILLFYLHVNSLFLFLLSTLTSSVLLCYEPLHIFMKKCKEFLFKRLTALKNKRANTRWHR